MGGRRSSMNISHNQGVTLSHDAKAITERLNNISNIYLIFHELNKYTIKTLT